MSRPLRVGIAGLGFGAAVHVPGWRSVPGVEVVGVCGRRLDHAQDVAARLGVAAAFDSVDQLLDCGLDVMSIALPPDVNESACRAAFERDLAVLCEKPIAASAASAAELADLARGTMTAVDFQFRELPAFAALRRQLDGEALQAVRNVEIVWRVQSYAHRQGQWSWKTDRRRGGGVLAVLGSHLLYLLEWLFGPIQALCAREDDAATRRLAPAGESPAEDIVNLWIEHASGVFVSALVTNSFPGPAIHRWTITRDRSVLVLENCSSDYMAGFSLLERTDRTERILFADSPDPSRDGRLAPFSSLAARFAAAVRTGSPMDPDFSAGWRVQLLMETAHQSAAACGASMRLAATTAAC